MLEKVTDGTEKMKSEYCKISLTGDLGSGKSTVCALLAERTGAEVISIGALQRKMAREKGIKFYEFNAYMEAHPEVDDEFDTMLKNMDAVNDRPLLFDSRMAWNFVPSAFSVYITTDLYEAARRVFAAHRENESYTGVEDAMLKLSERRASEMLRYSELYKKNIKDLNNYDLVVDSTSASPEKVASLILSEYQSYAAGKCERRRYFSPYRLYPLENAGASGEVKVCAVEDFYFVTDGIDALKKAVSEKKSEVRCELVELCEADKTAYIAQNCAISSLKEWESERRIKFIRYPDII